MAINIYAPLTGDGIESEELKLYNLINSYRQQYGLSPITLSASLSLVANRHVRDLQENIGYLTHGWSDAPYSSSDPNTWPSMWTAPQRFKTAYTGYGYENAYWSSSGATAEGALQSWQSSAAHKAVILNLGNWASRTWNAIGIGIYGKYAVMWVGEQVDPAGSPLGYSPPIDPDQYGASYGDLIRAYGYNPTAFLNHYNKYGKFEGRQPDLFDELRYLASHADLIKAFGYNPQAATKHYIQYGFNEKRSTTSFQARQYLASYGDLITAFGDNIEAATRHYIQYGFNEKRSTDAFNEAIYLASHGDLISAFGYNLEAATKHYIQHGFRENRSTKLFDPNTYLNNYADLKAAFGSNLDAATRHYIEFGFKEGRSYTNLFLPDLSIPGISAPTLVSSGQSFIIGTTVYNLGDFQVSNSQLRFYLSNDEILDAADLVLGTQNIPALAPSGSTYAFLNVTNSQSWGAGNKFILLKADYDNLIVESKENNNFAARGITLNNHIISVISPNGGNTLEAGKSYTITWDDNISENVRISLYQNGVYFFSIADSTESDGSYIWAVPSFTNTISNYQIRIESATNSGLFDYSDGIFTIAAPTPQVYKYDYIYYYNGNNDYYSGYAYGNANAYTVGSYYDYSSSYNETNANGRYYISSRSLTGTSSDLGKVYINNYYNSETSSSYIPYVSVGGSSGLGGEYGYLTSAQTSSNDLFGYDYYEADVVTNAVDLKGLYFDSSEPLKAGNSFNVTFNVQNLGNSGASSFKVGFYLSTDSNITTSDYYLGDYSLSGLAAGSNTGYLTKSLTLPVVGSSIWSGDKTYYIGMIVDYGGAVSETNEVNNASVGLAVDYDDVAISGTTAATSFNIRFDYRFDTNGFFNDSARRTTLEAAATIWENIIKDEFADIPVGTPLSVRDPQTGQTMKFNSDYVIDDLVVFVGARNIGETTLAIAGPSGTWIVGSDLDKRYNSASDFEPWTGSLSFNNAVSWFFDSTPNTANDIPGGSNDFLSVAVHEIGHILGISSNVAAFKNWVIGSTFTGTNAKYFNGGNSIPISADLHHIQDGFRISGMGENAMDPSIITGTRKLPTALDIALLDDIGYITSYSTAATNL